jgi:hypothetical protein
VSSLRCFGALKRATHHREPVLGLMRKHRSAHRADGSIVKINYALDTLKADGITMATSMKMFISINRNSILGSRS